MQENASQSKQKIVDRANYKVNLLLVKPGDYVYVLQETMGLRKKLQNLYDGPFVVAEVSSPQWFVCTIRLQVISINISFISID